MSELIELNEAAVKKAYARWAPVYDLAFGPIADAGRKRAVNYINTKAGRVLEVGIGTGISLPGYKPDLKITGIDLSHEMLEKARQRVQKRQLSHVEAILEMDAADLAFEDDSFDIVVAMYVLTVVPDPGKVMAELQRVCKPGGEVLVINHFSRTHGVRGRIERQMAPLAKTLGWRPEFPESEVMTCDNLQLIDRVALKPFGLFTMLKFKKQASDKSQLAA